MRTCGLIMPWVSVSGIPETIWSLWGPNQLSTLSELELDNVLSPITCSTGDGIRKRNQEPTKGLLQRTDKVPKERFVQNRCLLAGVYWKMF